MPDQLKDYLLCHSGAVAERWQRSVLITSFTAYSPAEVRTFLETLVVHLIDVLCCEGEGSEQAREIGVDLANFGFTHPSTLEISQRVLLEALLPYQEFPELDTLRNRLASLLFSMASGAIGQVIDTILTEQEHVRDAILTERERAEEALRKSEASLAEAQRIAHVGHWDYDIVRDELVWSDEIYRIFGLEPVHEVGGLAEFQRYVHPDDLDFLVASVEQAFKGDPCSLDHRIIRPDGVVRVVHQQFETVFGEAGMPIRLFGTVHDITDQKMLEEQLEYQAFHDSLTGLPNRAQFMEKLQTAVVRARRTFRPIAVLFLDLDGFKHVNDSLGHEAGDRLLFAVSDRLRACLDAGQTVARLGGDEFTILLENVDGADVAVLTAESIMRELHAPFRIGERDLYVTTSIGIVFSQGDGADHDDLLRDADLAMYRAKDRGKARYELFDKSMNTIAMQRLTVEADLRRAVERKEFVVHYQPLINLRTGQVAGLEALARWKHPTRGTVLPQVFIELAEETGMILPIGRWILEKACLDLKTWQRTCARPDLFISVNLSVKQLQNAELVSDVESTLLRTGLDADRLALEVTESMLMEDHPHGGPDVIRELKRLGVRLVIDDFGTGYSSLSYLKRLPIDYLKIDQTFVSGLGTSDVEDPAIVQAITSLSRSLGIKLMAEGIRNEDQLAYLRSVDCEFGQGSLFSMPVPAKRIPAMLGGSE